MTLETHVKKLLQESGCDKCFRFRAFHPAREDEAGWISMFNSRKHEKQVKI